jgi:hypothetical protein
MELSVVEQRYQAVLAVIRDGVPIVEVARRAGRVRVRRGRHLDHLPARWAPG